MRSTQALLASAIFASTVLADFAFTSPAAGQSYAGGSEMTVAFTDSEDSPTISSYTLSLCAGGNTPSTYECNTDLITDASPSTLSTVVTIPTSAGANVANAYFLRMVSQVAAGGTITDFSDRFTLTGMTGTFSSDVETALGDVPDHFGPPAQNPFAKRAVAAAAGAAVAATTAAAAAATDQYTVPYHLQTGLTKYAPMQPIPPTKITATSPTPLNPTSAYTIATTYMSTPTIVITVTESQTFSVSSMENSNAAQTRTTDSMGNWAKRWLD